jgi:hypothetical protein
MNFSLISAALGLSQFVPSMARWLGGEKAERVAEEVVAIAKNICGEGDSTQLIKLLQENPELLINFQKAMIQLEAELELHQLHDRQDARARDVALITNGQGNLRADIMVVCAAGGLISCLVSLAYYSDHLPGEAVGIISTIAGIFGACLKDAYAFEFGSSRESKLRNTTMAAMIERGGI